MAFTHLERFALLSPRPPADQRYVAFLRRLPFLCGYGPLAGPVEKPLQEALFEVEMHTHEMQPQKLFVPTRPPARPLFP